MNYSDCGGSSFLLWAWITVAFLVSVGTLSRAIFPHCIEHPFLGSVLSKPVSKSPWASSLAVPAFLREISWAVCSYSRSGVVVRPVLVRGGHAAGCRMVSGRFVWGCFSFSPVQKRVPHVHGEMELPLQLLRCVVLYLSCQAMLISTVVFMSLWKSLF